MVGEIVTDQDIPLFSGAVKHGNTLYIAGKGAHVEPYEIKAHTEIVLQELQKGLEANGSSMEQVLKVNVYLADLADYKGMNEVFRGRFGKNPPVRTTVAKFSPVSVYVVTSAVQVIEGSCVSFIITVELQVVLFPAASSITYVTVVTPILNISPDALLMPVTAELL